MITFVLFRKFDIHVMIDGNKLYSPGLHFDKPDLIIICICDCKTYVILMCRNTISRRYNLIKEAK